MPENGRFDLVYLDVWRRHITALEDPALLEKALGGADTTTRLQTVWQVKVRTGVKEDQCDSQFAPWPPLPPLDQRGRLTSQTVVVPGAADPCLITPGGGYRGLENRLYRVEIHDDSASGTPTFKWSRDNGSVVFAVDEFVPGKPKEVKVKRLGKDQILALHVGDWVEVLDDASELAGKPGTMAQITEIDEAQRKLKLSAAVTGYQVARHAKVRRWDQPSAPIPITAATFDLEDGIQVAFKDGPHITGDYWAFAARTATGDIEELKEAPPQGIEHHYCRLAIIQWKKVAITPKTAMDEKTIAREKQAANKASAETLKDAEEERELELLLAYMKELDAAEALEDEDKEEIDREFWQPIIHDCRHIFPPLTALRENCCTLTVGDGRRSHGQFRDIQKAVNHLPPEGGKVCILPGKYELERPVVIQGRVNVIIAGCLPNTWIDVQTDKPAFIAEDCTGLHLENLGLKIKAGVIAIMASRSQQVYVEGNHIIGRVKDKPSQKQATQAGDYGTLVFDRCRYVWVEGNILEIGGTTGLTALGKNLTVRENLVWGGLQIWEGSQDILVQGNEIVRGKGHGIVFQSLPGKKVTPEANAAGDEDEQVIPIRQTLITSNLIGEMAGSGIAVASQPNLDDPASLITTDFLTISDNRILSCAREVSEDNGRSVYGGIVLAGGKHIHIHGNRIEDCGPETKLPPQKASEADAAESGEVLEVPFAGTVAAEKARKPVATALETDSLAAARSPMASLNMRLGGANPATMSLKNNLRYWQPILVELTEGEKPAAPIAGIYVFQSEGLEISHNRILNNGSPRVGEQAVGRQGGIIVKHAAVRPLQMKLNDRVTLTLPDGYPAAKIHSNTIIVPRGPALQLHGFGPMAVTDNQLTSQGAIPVILVDDSGNQQPGVQTLGVVQIINVGVADELIGLFQGFLGLVQTQAKVYAGGTAEATHFAETATNATDVPQINLGGSVLFSDNQVTFNLVRPEQELAAGAVWITSLDDLAFHDNQLDVVLLPNDYILANAIIGGLRMRAGGNVFKETLNRCYYSCMSMAIMNMVTNNQGNHCFGLWGLPQYFVDQNNIALACQLDRKKFNEMLIASADETAELEATKEWKAAQAYTHVLEATDAYQPTLMQESRTIQSFKVRQLQAEKDALSKQLDVEEVEIATIEMELAASNAVKTRLDELATYDLLQRK
jgi:hypothetical protein